MAVVNVTGIDASLTCTGVAVAAGGDVLELRRVRTPTGPQTLVAQRARVRRVLTQVLEVAPSSGLYVVESPSLQSKFGLRIERIGLFWMLVDQLLARGPVVTVTPKGRAKYASGNGNAKKPEVLAAMRERFPGLQIPDDNVADALALVGMGARHLGEPIDGVLGKQYTEPMVKVTWPTKEEWAKWQFS